MKIHLHLFRCFSVLWKSMTKFFRKKKATKFIDERQYEDVGDKQSIIHLYCILMHACL